MSFHFQISCNRFIFKYPCLQLCGGCIHCSTHCVWNWHCYMGVSWNQCLYALSNLRSIAVGFWWLKLLRSTRVKYIRIHCPSKSGSLFYNNEKYFSIVLQAVVDVHYKFLTINIGGHGKQSDGGSLKPRAFTVLLWTKTCKFQSLQHLQIQIQMSWPH